MILELHDTMRPEGTLEIIVRDVRGCDPKRPESIDNPGRLLRREVVRNTITDLGMTQMIYAITGSTSTTAMVSVELGTGTTAATTSDTTIETSKYVASPTSKSETATTMTFRLFLPSTKANGNDLIEVAVTDSASASGNAYFRTLHTKETKTNTKSITYIWTITLAPG